MSWRSSRCRYSRATLLPVPMRRHLANAVELARSAGRLLIGGGGAAAAGDDAGAASELVEAHLASCPPADGEDLLTALPAELKARPSRAACR